MARREYGLQTSEHRVDAYLDGDQSEGDLDRSTLRFIKDLEALHSAQPYEDFRSDLALSLRLRAGARAGSPRWFTVRLEDWLHSPGGPLRILAGAAALILLGIVVGVMLPLEVTARPATSPSRLGQLMPIHAGWDDLAKVPGPALMNSRAPYKSLLKEPMVLSKHNVTLTLREIALLFGDRGTPVGHERSVDGSELVVFSWAVVVLEVRNESGGPLTWEAHDPLVLAMPGSAGSERLVVTNGPSMRGLWGEFGRTVILPEGDSTWAIQLKRQVLARGQGNVVQIDAIPWSTPSVTARVGSIVVGGEERVYDFGALPLDWASPIVDPTLRQWKGEASDG